MKLVWLWSHQSFWFSEIWNRKLNTQGHPFCSIFKNVEMLKKLFPALVFVALFSLGTYAQKVKEPEHPDKEHEKAEKEGDKNNHMETWHGSGVPEIKETKESNPSEKKESSKTPLLAILAEFEV